MPSMFPLLAKSASESDLSQTRLDAERKNAEEFSVQHPTSQALVGSSGFIPSLGARVNQPGAELAGLKRKNYNSPQFLDHFDRYKLEPKMGELSCASKKQLILLTLRAV